MKNVRFYLDFGNEQRKRRAGTPMTPATNCIAVLLDMPANFGHVAALSAVFYHANSDTNFGEVSLDYLRQCCKRCSEDEARKVHPRLLARLDHANAEMEQKAQTYGAGQVCKSGGPKCS